MNCPACAQPIEYDDEWEAGELVELEQLTADVLRLELVYVDVDLEQLAPDVPVLACRSCGFWCSGDPH